MFHVQLRRRTALPTELAPATLSSVGGDDGSPISKGVQMFRQKELSNVSSSSSTPTNTIVKQILREKVQNSIIIIIGNFEQKPSIVDCSTCQCGFANHSVVRSANKISFLFLHPK